MKRIIFGSSLILTLLFSWNISAQECQIPEGTYKYLYSDGNESYFFNADYTIRIDSSGTRILQKGDFNVKLNGFTYRRVGDNFYFSNPLASYSSYKNGPIVYNSPTYSTAIALAPVGYRHVDEYGYYVKNTDGKVIFTPKRRLTDLIITRDNCGGKTIRLNYDKSAVIANLGVKRVGDNLVVNLKNDILFDFNSSEISPQSSETLKQLAYLIQQDRKGLVVIRGHADAIGEDDYNQRLSAKRAEAVSKWLQVLAELPASNFVAQGIGESSPIAPNTNPDGSDNPAGRSKNRRVEVLIQTVEGSKIPEATRIIKLESLTIAPRSDTLNSPEENPVAASKAHSKKVVGIYSINAATKNGTEVFDDCSGIEILQDGSFYQEDEDTINFKGTVVFNSANGSRKSLTGVINLNRQ